VDEFADWKETALITISCPEAAVGWGATEGDAEGDELEIGAGAWEGDGVPVDWEQPLKIIALTSPITSNNAKNFFIPLLSSLNLFNMILA